MLSVLACITREHNIWLVILAAIVCAVGSWVVIRLFGRAAATTGPQRVGWHFLTAVAAGSSIWCTHFIAMLGYQPGTTITLDPILTIVSLFIAVGGAGLSFALADSGLTRVMPAVGGACLGLATAGMHYTGMMAYQVQGLVFWDMAYIIASILLAVVFCATSLHFAQRRRRPSDTLYAVASLVLGIISLHFTAMTALQVTPFAIDTRYAVPGVLEALALATGAVALIIVGTGFASYIIDDLQRLESARKLRHLARNDTITGLPNRLQFNEHMDHELYMAEEAGHGIATVAIDLDNFKEINDLGGHDLGDAVLKEIGSRLEKSLRDGEFIARVGGDEFIAVFRDRGQRSLAEFLSRLERTLDRPILSGGQEISTTASFGIAVYPGDATDRETLVNNANLATSRAKADMTRTMRFYEARMDESVRARRALARDLRAALDAGQLEMHYQVQTEIATGKTSGYEALLRWNHPDKGPISPADFVPLAEENGLILELGEWALQTACATAVDWPMACKVAVNLSPVQFADSALPDMVRDVLRETGLPANRLELELTESTILEDQPRSLYILQQIRAMGVTIALDDFGTGYSSLDTLQRYPFDKIKLDRSFISELEHSQEATAIVRAIVALGKSLDIAVLAEGIETAGQLDLLKREGCNEAQGFYLGRPAATQQMPRTEENPAPHLEECLQPA